jgi:Zn-finger nucleic acid-binding protein
VCVDVDLSISSREGVEIDFCAQCRGVWLDRGELDKILDRVSVAQPRPAPEPVAAYDRRGGSDDRDRDRDRDRAPDHRSDDDRDRKKRKKRSFLDDLFDFD